MGKKDRNRLPVGTVEKLPSSPIQTHDSESKKMEGEGRLEFYARLFKLPRLELPKYIETVDDYGRSLASSRNDGFDIKALATLIQNGCAFSGIQSYIRNYEKGTVRAAISTMIWSEIEFWNILFFAIERNCIQCVRTLLEYGANPDTKTPSEKVPVIAFAFIIAKWTVSNSTEVVKALLEHGADLNVVPKDIWIDYLEVPRAKLQDIQNQEQDPRWCRPGYRSLLVETMHLGHRYSFFRASLQEAPTIRTKQMAKAHRINGLLQIPHHIVGQGPATKIIMDQIFAECVLDNLRPLVMVFAGPSGHGKTELAKQMGDLLSIKTSVIDCAQVRTEWQLFGAAAGYERSKEGSPLNNFLLQNDGKRCVVFLDEFDKTVEEVRQALLRICESDRTTNTSIDCAKVVWILASNLGDLEIQKFYSSKMKDKNDRQRYDISVDSLQKTLRSVFKPSWGSPFVSRIRVIVPFFPFSPGEQAVIFHGQLVAFANDIRKPINVHQEAKKYVGHCHLAVPRSTDVSKHIATLYYDQELGARAFFSAIDDIKVKFLRAHNMVDRKVTEKTNNGPLQKYTCQLHPGDDDEEYIVLFKDGSTEFWDQKVKGVSLAEDDTDSETEG